jgi:hypothetical protein
MGSRIVKKGNVRHVRLTVCRVMSERSASFAAGVLCISCEATSGRSGESSSRGRRLSGPCLSTVTVSAWRWNASTSVFLMHRHLQTLLDQYDAAVPNGFLQLSDLSDRLDTCLHLGPGTRDEMPLSRADPFCWTCVLDATLFCSCVGSKRVAPIPSS